MNLSSVVTDALGGTIKVNGIAVTSGNAASVPLNMGNNTITIECLAEDNITKKTYTIVINRSSTPEYCTPAGDISYGDNVNSFTLAGENGTSINDNNTGGSANGYVYRSSLPLIKLLQNKTYAATVTTQAEPYSGSDGDHIKIWIDYNDNFTFESNELAYQSPGLILLNKGLNFNLPIPANANPGTHRMRIRSVYEDPYNSSNFDACNDDYGETHDYNISIITLSPLPLNLLSFNAFRVQSNIQVNWTSTAEVNVDRYEVEKSSNGVAFAKEKAVPAKMGSSVSEYTWVDRQPFAGNNYYRLKMIDKNGEVKYSAVEKVNLNNKSEFIKVIPNPVTNHTLGLHLNNVETGSYEIRLFDLKGQKVFNGFITKSINSGVQTIQLPKSLNSGIYRLQMANTSNTYSTSILIE